MSKHIALWTAALLLMAGTLTACGSDGISGGTVAAANTGFPGTPITDHLTAIDGRAFNDLSAIANKGLQVFWNRANGHAIVMYPDTLERLFAHYWNGTSFTPAVELTGPQQRISDGDDSNTGYFQLRTSGSNEGDDRWGGLDGFRVLFLNTNVQGRNGDAIIAWARFDQDPPAGVDPDQDGNCRLYATYFDASEAGTVNGDIRYGFDTTGTAVDFDNIETGAGNDDSVVSFGFVSDSLCGSHGFDSRSPSTEEWEHSRYQQIDENVGGIRPATRSGDPTNFVFLVWIKGQSSGGSTTPGARVQYVEFNLQQGGNAIPAQPALGANTLDAPAALGGLDMASDVADQMVCHNECLIWRGTTAAGEHTFLSCFANAQVPVTIELSDRATFTTDTVVPRPTDVYGADHGGLVSLYAFFPDNGGTNLYAAQVNRDAPLVQGQRQIEDIDGGSTATVFDGTRINRDSNWILALWQAGTALRAHALQTRKAGTRTLANALVTGGPFPVPNQSAPITGPARITFQSELARGTDCDPICGIQSNANRMNWVWHETGAVADVDLMTNGLTIALSLNDANAPTATFPFTVATDGILENGDLDYTPLDRTGNGFLPIVTDLGTAAGDALVYFLSNENNPGDDTAGGAFDEVRLFGIAAVPGVTPGDRRLVSRDGPATDFSYSPLDATQGFNSAGGRWSSANNHDFGQVGGEFLRVVTTPRSLVPGNHGGTNVHVFFAQSGREEGSLPELNTRNFTKASFNPANLATFGTAHIPALGTDPFNLDGIANTDARMPHRSFDDNGNGQHEFAGPFTTFATVNGTTVGIYFTSGRHFWYQEFNGSEWFDANGDGDPALIDETSPNGLFGGVDQHAYAFARRLIGSCDDLNGALVFYAKVPPGEDIGFRRYFARSRN